MGCHAEVTKAQQTDRKLAKRRAKEQLKTALKELEDTDHMKCNRSNLDTSVRNVRDVLDNLGLLLHFPFYFMLVLYLQSIVALEKKSFMFLYYFSLFQQRLFD